MIQIVLNLGLRSKEKIRQEEARGAHSGVGGRKGSKSESEPVEYVYSNTQEEHEDIEQFEERIKMIYSVRMKRRMNEMLSD